MGPLRCTEFQSHLPVFATVERPGYFHDLLGIRLDPTAKGADKGWFPIKTGRAAYRVNIPVNQTSVSSWLLVLAFLTLFAVRRFRSVSAYLA